MCVYAYLKSASCVLDSTLKQIFTHNEVIACIQVFFSNRLYSC